MKLVVVIIKPHPLVHSHAEVIGPALLRVKRQTSRLR